jgi:hypothetical protein
MILSKNYQVFESHTAVTPAAYSVSQDTNE